MNYSTHLNTQGYLNIATIKREYTLFNGQLVVNPEPPPIIEAPTWEKDQLIEETDLYRKPHFTDVVVQGHIHTPGGAPQTQLEAGIRVGSVFRQFTVTGQRHLDLSQGAVRFSTPEPFHKVPLVWEEAYGGTDSPNEALGDLWDLKNLGQSMGKDLSFMNLCRYRRNPFGKGYILQLLREHDGTPLPRIEFSHDRLTPERIAVGQPINWHAMPSPACFLWQGYDSFPRMAFMGGKLTAAMADQVPNVVLPEYTFGFTRDELFSKENPDKLAQHPRFFNGAHPSLQCPLFGKKTPISLYHFDPDHPELSFSVPGTPPLLRLEPPGHGKVYREEATLSQVVLDLDTKTLTATWHAFVRTQLPVLPDYTKDIRWDVKW